MFPKTKVSRKRTKRPRKPPSFTRTVSKTDSEIGSSVISSVAVSIPITRQPCLLFSGSLPRPAVPMPKPEFSAPGTEDEWNKWKSNIKNSEFCPSFSK